MPAQTRGFLFSDLRGYSAFVEQHGDEAARELLGRYRRVVRSVIGRFEGAEIRTEGDSFYVVFGSVGDAVRAGLAILDALRGEGDASASIPVGIGLHAGEAEDSDEGIVSSAVNIAARICAVAEAGELLVSETVRALTRTYLDVAFVPRGRRRLKGISEPVVLYRVAAEPRSARVPRSGRSVPRMIGVVAAAGLVAVAAFVIVLLAATFMREGAASLSSTAPDASPSTPDVTPSPAQLPSEAGPDDGAFPNAAEEALLSRLPVTMAIDRCLRADPDEIPRVPTFHDEGLEPLPTAAAVRCPQGSGLDVYFFSGAPCNLVTACRSDSEAAIISVATRRQSARGACAADVNALDRWEFGRAAGWVLCGDDTMWTYDGSDLLGRATSERPGVAYEWWHANARFPAD